MMPTAHIAKFVTVIFFLASTTIYCLLYVFVLIDLAENGFNLKVLRHDTCRLTVVLIL